MYVLFIFSLPAPTSPSHPHPFPFPFFVTSPSSARVSNLKTWRPLCVFSLRYIFVCQCLHHFITSYFCKNDDLRQRFVKMRRLSQTWKQKRTSERSSNHVIKQRIPNVHQINDDKDCRRNSSKVRYIQEIHSLRYKTVIELAKLSIKVNLSRVTAFFLDSGFGVIINCPFPC